MSAAAEARKVWAEGESNMTGSSQKREDMARYVEWLLTPPEEREPKTKTAFAAEIGVSLQTLRNWAREPFVQRELVERARAVARIDRVPAVLDALYAQASDPENPRSVQAARALFDWMRETSGAREADLNVEEMTSEDLIGVALELLQRQADKRTQE